MRDDRPAGSVDPPAVLFRYCPTAKVSAPSAPGDFRGVLQADAYAGFDRLYRENDQRGGLLGARAAQVLRYLRGHPLIRLRGP